MMTLRSKCPLTNSHHTDGKVRPTAPGMSTITRGAGHFAVSSVRYRPSRRSTLPQALSTDFPGLPNSEVYRPNDKDYQSKRYQYATSSHHGDGGMYPGAIVYPKHPNADADVIKVLEYARSKKIAVAVRTGGHQYSGLSSTSQNNIQLDLSKAYRDFEWNNETGLLQMGVSFTLGELNRELGNRQLFVPHGHCTHVNVGGHAHSGGYGLSGRALGLFSDHIEAIRIITADGTIRNISRGTENEDDRELFYAVLGGSPGNYGILTGITLKPNRDANHPNSRGYLSFKLYYCRSVLEDLLKIKADMVSNADLAADFDLCITVMSGGRNVLDKYGIKVADDEWEKAYAEAKEELSKMDVETQDIVPPVVIVWAQWANLGGAKQPFDENARIWFEDIKNALGRSIRVPGTARIDSKAHTPMSKLAAAWTFPIEREFNTPYIKRTYFGKQDVPLAANWPQVVTDRVEAVMWHWGCHVVLQAGHYGGKNSRYTTKDPEDRTSYSWRRDGTMCLTMDCFYDPPRDNGQDHGQNPMQFAQQWQADNDRIMKGPNGVFSPGVDRRLLWATYNSAPAEGNMYNAWRFYYEDEAKYARLCKIKAHVDPNGVFTPNEFCVGVPPHVGI